MLHLKPNNPKFPKPLITDNLNINDLYIESNHWEELVKLPKLAVVGSRKSSAYGQYICQTIVKEIACRGVVIVSGLALGIDSFAHKAALEVNGKTIAVLPSGFNNIYPSSHNALAREIVKKGGALVSEYSPNSKIAFKANFIARNRIIAGLSDAILIPEAAEKSGSLHTANFALDLGKEIFAAPGPINSPNSSGCNNLIKSGAQIVTSVSDILNYFNITDKSHITEREIIADNHQEQVILELIAGGVTDADKILTESKLNSDIFNQTLSMLEIKGRIRAVGGNNWILL